MTPAEFRTALERLALTQGQAAEALGLDIRTVNRYANQGPIPAPVALALRYLQLEENGRH